MIIDVIVSVEVVPEVVVPVLVTGGLPVLGITVLEPGVVTEVHDYAATHMVLNKATYIEH